MLARSRRLRASRDISRVLARGRFGSGGELTVKALATGRPDTRMAIVVSKKISKQAVVRNRIRRRLSEQIAESWQTLKPGYDIVVIARADLSETPIAQVQQKLKGALAAAGAV